MKTNEAHPLPIGVSMQNKIVNFSMEVESGKTCYLCLYKKNEEKPTLKLEMIEESGIGNIRCIALNRADVKGMEYLYEIENEMMLDPYVRVLVNTEYGLRGKVFIESYDWEGDKPLEIPQHEVIAYTLHVRGFTKHRSSKVKKKGTFQGLAEKIPYLLELGINQVQCMPIYSFEESSRYKNYWGYGEAHCFAVKNSYAAGKNAEKELKDMIKAFHKNGIEVVLNLPFFDNASKTMILDCLRYYVKEYHIDGFILNPGIAPMECICSDGMLKKTKILQNKNDFQDAFRCFLRGDKGMLPQIMQGLKTTVSESGSYNYITNHNGFTLRDLVSYNKKHNEANGENNVDGPVENYSWNCGREGNTSKTHILELRSKQMRNAMALLMFAKGTPCILAGDEFGNTQQGNNNVYCQDNEIAWLDWTKLDKEKKFFEYVKELIRLRKIYFCSKEPFTGTDKTGCGVPDVSYHGEDAWQINGEIESCELGVYYHLEDDKDVFVAYNMNSNERAFALPQLKKMKKWYRIFSTESGVVQEEILECNQQKTIVNERTIAIFVGR